MEELDFEMEREIYNNLALAVVRQAIDDWRDLCSGKEKENAKCNFDELTQFFKNDCEGYLDDTDISADRIYKILIMERNRAKNKAVV